MLLPDNPLTRMVGVLAPSTRPFHVETPGTRQRRRYGVALTLAIGTLLLALALGTSPGDHRFYPLTIALACSWLIGAAVSGPLHLGRWTLQRGDDEHGGRDLLLPAALAVAAFAVFVAGDLLFQQVPVLARQVTEIISRADTGGKPLVVFVALLNGVAEEVFFRGALYSAFGPHRPALWSTVAYTVATAFTGNLALVVAGAAMGTLFALERRATRGVLASAITHVVWSVLVIAFLPRP